MIDEVETLVAEILLDRETLTERFLTFLSMEIFIKQLRHQGLDNYQILELCKSVDKRREDEGEDSQILVEA